MTKLAANLTMLFTELPFIERFRAAAQANFKAVEFLFPYAFEPAQIAEQLRKNELELVLHNLPAGNWEAGERGIACHPDRVGEFRQGVDDAIRYAKILGVKQLNCLVGIQQQGVSAAAARETLVANLKFAADKLQAEGIALLIEPINYFDIPGFFLNTTKQAAELIASTGSNNLFIQYDIYHMQRMEGELANTIKANLSLIRHVQLADNPGRFEPGTGEINYRFLFKYLDEIGYQGWIGCEYKPKAGTVEGLGWRAAHGL
ncbi:MULTISPECIES: hydroxypyruvate isomerase [unclassified Herbaspirillum]|uniref:hydroxypyruvate isomerase n=1 Tax=unclassified Herbaspirillum TaxID=2624150 RepID=UPI000E2E469F|nr:MULTISPECIES: hydroxypyruvate isomerase [unclassified Herbaspirillum]RFB73960.1 hydroxypyruvate isomerase [Herbaspirillum sp. 3R-3a1]TFI10229.1 hydroxypyruvate isomerase [Herbaspirillum sp. 3R11]TFI16133.1 hydroxypyruvate isomerase [Herbaspirillum sp. 3R-11]TFI22844.1 hydroxypyruvate isomerase [Herbaspirillum sp. 3C11]